MFVYLPSCSFFSSPMISSTPFLRPSFDSDFMRDSKKFWSIAEELGVREDAPGEGSTTEAFLTGFNEGVVSSLVSLGASMVKALGRRRSEVAAWARLSWCRARNSSSAMATTSAVSLVFLTSCSGGAMMSSYTPSLLESYRTDIFSLESQPDGTNTASFSRTCLLYTSPSPRDS
eukprot:TRINITY_DN1056_c0_g1_i1.p1 TRINITY_DN1056_c0_g1~~TRINITY_DN1056_c0_g1_i1.p1  ORF type:complete len:174 (+),score=6.61 TRINITY_DN1056_c0_g1_i1:151-672(+)